MDFVWIATYGSIQKLINILCPAESTRYDERGLNVDTSSFRNKLRFLSR